MAFGSRSRKQRAKNARRLTRFAQFQGYTGRKHLAIALQDKLQRSLAKSWRFLGWRLS